MTLQAITKRLGEGGSHLSDGTLRKALQELQALKTTVVSGTTAATSITVTGLGASDTIQSVIKYSSGVPSDVTSTATVFAAAALRLSGDSSGTTLVVSWWQKPAS